MTGVVAWILLASSGKGVGKGGRKKIMYHQQTKKSNYIKSEDRGGQAVRSPSLVSVGSFDPRILQCEIMEALRLPGVAHNENTSFKTVLRNSSNTSAYATPNTALSAKHTDLIASCFHIPPRLLCL